MLLFAEFLLLLSSYIDVSPCGLYLFLGGREGVLLAELDALAEA